MGQCKVSSSSGKPFWLVVVSLTIYPCLLQLAKALPISVNLVILQENLHFLPMSLGTCNFLNKLTSDFLQPARLPAIHAISILKNRVFVLI